MLEADGTISVFIGSSAVGQGVETVFAQIAADALEIPIDRIRGVSHGSTTLLKEGYGAYHSRSVVMGGSALLEAANTLRDLMRTHAAKRLGCQPSDVALGDVGARAETVDQPAKAVDGPRGVVFQLHGIPCISATCRCRGRCRRASNERPGPPRRVSDDSGPAWCRRCVGSDG